MNILILGASSAIAMATARHLCTPDNHFFLAGRDPEKIEACAKDLATRGAGSKTPIILDFAELCPGDIETAAGQFDEAIDVVLIAFGALTNQDESLKNGDYLREQFRLNAESSIMAMQECANILSTQGHGKLVVIGSVAGDRGRYSNFSYGAAKAAVHAFAGGLRAHLLRHDCHLLLVKPGMVDTPMTQGIDAPPLLLADPDKVGKSIARAIDSGKTTVYVPGLWRWIMLVITLIPEFIFKRLSL